MWTMWIKWDIGLTATLLTAVAFALLLATLLERAAYLLPRYLDAQIMVGSSWVQRSRLVVFWVLGSILAMLCAWLFGPTPIAAAAIVYALMLLTLGWIDAEAGLLPDLLSLPLLWMGLLVNISGVFSPLSDAVIGAVVGYLSLWCVGQVFTLLTGRLGMGHGDFKLLAALGAWVGWLSLPWVLLLSSSFALVVALILRVSGRMKANDPIRFGPYLAGAGIVALLRLA